MVSSRSVEMSAKNFLDIPTLKNKRGASYPTSSDEVSHTRRKQTSNFDIDAPEMFQMQPFFPIVLFFCGHKDMNIISLALSMSENIFV